MSTKGMVANLPTVSVLVSTLSRSFGPILVNFTALARSIRWGKSTFQSWGGV